MSLLNIWSRRKRKSLSPDSEIFTYDDIPKKVRVQIIHIFSEIEGKSQAIQGSSLAAEVVNSMRKELGVFDLSTRISQNSFHELSNWFLEEKNLDYLLDAVELMFALTFNIRSDWTSLSTAEIQRYISEFNGRMLEGSVGYQYENSEIIKVSDQYVHKEIILPAIRLVSEGDFPSADKEFMAAHAAYRKGEYETSMTECLKALESVLKVLGAKHGWGTLETDSAGRLIAAAFTNNFIPTFVQSEFNALRSLLEAGVPTVRNKSSGHGAGTQKRQVPKSLATFQINQTAAAIRYLIDTDKGD